ncbi:hypothetical protein [Nonomuraea salmonea]|uniref:hypothetical protein n=1 Tax=Nonomuraea salmonea TaxID=46181 RepID=UPI002FEC2E2A
MTIKEIAALPADPEALKNRAAEAIRRDRDFAGSVADGLPPTLASLLYALPASPQVRGAAYQALAKLPAVRVEGRTTDVRGAGGRLRDLPAPGRWTCSGQADHRP